jgi:hypothetical protein
MFLNNFKYLKEVKMKTFKQALYDSIIKNASEYEDGETGLHNCVEKYCKEYNIDLNIGSEAYEYYVKKEALSAGIPLGVVEVRIKLTDFFSKEYIDWKTNNILKGDL